MLNLVWAVLKVFLILVLGVVSVAVLLGLCAYLFCQAIESIGYWAAYASNKKSWPYSRTLTEILWAHVIAASASITMMLLFAFLKIIDAAGFYLLWPPSALIGYFVVALVIATNLHRFWSYDKADHAAALLRAIEKAEARAVPLQKADEIIAEPIAAQAVQEALIEQTSAPAPEAAPAPESAPSPSAAVAIEGANTLAG